MQLMVGQALPGRARLRLAMALTVAAMAAWLPASVEARPSTSTKVVHYSVSGTSASTLDAQMNALGPRVNGAHAYANIVARPDYSGRLIEGKYCRLQNFKVSASFTLTLPKLASGTRLSKDLNSRWQSFVAFARRHEETHRAIWIECLGKAERRVLALKIGSCQALDAEIGRIFDAEWQICERRQSAFDAAERSKLGRHPFIVAASRVDRTASRVKVASKSTSRRTEAFSR
jgi:predicted secreted Zn-dependent protease